MDQAPASHGVDIVRVSCVRSLAVREALSRAPAFFFWAAFFFRWKGPLDSTPIVAVVVSAVAGATALIALGIFVKRRRASKQKTTQPPAIPPGYDDDSLEQGRDQPQGAQPPSSAVLALGRGGGKSPSSEHNGASPHRDTPTDADGFDHGRVVPVSLKTSSRLGPVQSSTEHATHGAVEDEPPSPQREASPPDDTPAIVNGGEDIGTISPSAPTPFDGQAQSSPEHASNAAAAAAAAAEGDGAGLSGEDAVAGGSAEKSLTATVSVSTTSDANFSTAERAELVEPQQSQRAADVASAFGGPVPEVYSGDDGEASSSADRKSSAGDIGLSGAVMAAAEELAHHCQIPGVSEAASAVCIMANLVADSRDNTRACESRLRQCRSIVMALKRADEVASKVS